MINNLVSYFKPDGTPTTKGIEEFRQRDAREVALTARVAALEAQLAAIAAVTGPAGGATVDAEARTAIDAIIAGAA